MTTPAALPPLPFNPSRVRSYLVRLPLFTRLVLIVIIALWLLYLQTIWDIVQWGSLIPDEIGIGTSMYQSPSKSGSAVLIRYSAPPQYLSRYPYGVLSCLVERLSAYSFAREV